MPHFRLPWQQNQPRHQQQLQKKKKKKKRSGQVEAAPAVMSYPQSPIFNCHGRRKQQQQQQQQQQQRPSGPPLAFDSLSNASSSSVTAEDDSLASMPLSLASSFAEPPSPPTEVTPTAAAPLSSGFADDDSASSSHDLGQLPARPLSPVDSSDFSTDDDDDSSTFSSCSSTSSSSSNSSLASPSRRRRRHQRHRRQRRRRQQQEQPHPPAAGGTRGVRARVLYDFPAGGPQELAAKAGDIVRVLYHVDRRWVFAASRREHSGYLPFLFVSKLDSTCHRRVPSFDRYRCCFPWDALEAATVAAAATTPSNCCGCQESAAAAEAAVAPASTLTTTADIDSASGSSDSGNYEASSSNSSAASCGGSLVTTTVMLHRSASDEAPRSDRVDASAPAHPPPPTAKPPPPPRRTFFPAKAATTATAPPSAVATAQRPDSLNVMTATVDAVEPAKGCGQVQDQAPSHSSQQQQQRRQQHHATPSGPSVPHCTCPRGAFEVWKRRPSFDSAVAQLPGQLPPLHQAQSSLSNHQRHRQTTAVAVKRVTFSANNEIIGVADNIDRVPCYSSCSSSSSTCCENDHSDHTVANLAGDLAGRFDTLSFYDNYQPEMSAAREATASVSVATSSTGSHLYRTMVDPDPQSSIDMYTLV